MTGTEFSFSEIEKRRASQMTVTNNFGNFTGVFGNNNSVGDISGGSMEKIRNIVKEAKKHYGDAPSLDADFERQIEDLERQISKPQTDKGAISALLSGIKSKLLEAGGNAVAMGLLQMIQSLGT